MDLYETAQGSDPLVCVSSIGHSASIDGAITSRMNDRRSSGPCHSGDECIRLALKDSDFSGSYEEWCVARSDFVSFIQPGDTVADVGCANGFLLVCIEQWLGKPIVPFGFDTDAGRLVTARRLFPLYADHFKLWNAFELPWPIPPVDVVLAPWSQRGDYLRQCAMTARRNVVFSLYDDDGKADWSIAESVCANAGLALEHTVERQSVTKLICCEGLALL